VVEPVETQGEVSTAPTGGRACRDPGWGLDGPNRWSSLSRPRVRSRQARPPSLGPGWRNST